jgi:tetratricopeptide (TPR) repeat protein
MRSPGEALPLRVRAFHLTPSHFSQLRFSYATTNALAPASQPENLMRPRVWALQLILTSSLCAQSEPPAHPLVANNQSLLPRLGETIPVRELLIPPKAVKELQLSQSALQSNDIAASARHLERALAIYPNYLEAHNSLGARYIALHEYQKASLEFQKAIAIDPRVVEPINNLSVAFFVLQRYPDAEAAARRALDLHPNLPASRYMLGCILAAEKRNPSEAMELLRTTKAEFPVSRLLLAEILLRQGAIDAAENELRDYLTVPGIENKHKVECWLVRLSETSQIPRPCA